MGNQSDEIIRSFFPFIYLYKSGKATHAKLWFISGLTQGWAAYPSVLSGNQISDDLTKTVYRIHLTILFTLLLLGPTLLWMVIRRFKR